MAFEIRDDIGFRVFTVKESPDTWRKDVKERGRENTPGRYRLGWEQNISARYGYG
jgi:hypothetical protein